MKGCFVRKLSSPEIRTPTFLNAIGTSLSSTSVTPAAHVFPIYAVLRVNVKGCKVIPTSLNLSLPSVCTHCVPPLFTSSTHPPSLPRRSRGKDGEGGLAIAQSRPPSTRQVGCRTHRHAQDILYIPLPPSPWREGGGAGVGWREGGGAGVDLWGRVPMHTPRARARTPSRRTETPRSLTCRSQRWQFGGDA